MPLSKIWTMTILLKTGTSTNTYSCIVWTVYQQESFMFITIQVPGSPGEVIFGIQANQTIGIPPKNLAF